MGTPWDRAGTPPDVTMGGTPPHTPKGRTYANFVYVLNASCAFHQRNTRI
jgi:hypothetical protein